MTFISAEVTADRCHDRRMTRKLLVELDSVEINRLVGSKDREKIEGGLIRMGEEISLREGFKIEDSHRNSTIKLEALIEALDEARESIKPEKVEA